MTSPRLFYSSSEDPLSVFSLPWWPVTVVLSHATGAKVKFSLLCFFFLLRLFVLGVLSHPLHAWAPFLFALFRSSLLCSFILFLLFFLFYLLCCRCQHRRICGRTRLCFYVCSCVCVCVCARVDLHLFVLFVSPITMRSATARRRRQRKKEKSKEKYDEGNPIRRWKLTSAVRHDTPPLIKVQGS